jgi:nickel and cobalt resistance protein CnrR
MSPARQAIILTIILAFLAGVAGAFLGTRLLAPKASQETVLHALLHSTLNLSAAQNKEIEEEEKRFERVRLQLESGVHNANVELAKAIRTSKRDGPEVRIAIEHVHLALGAYQKETVSHIFRMRSVLSPEQAELFDRSVTQTLMQAPQ